LANRYHVKVHHVGTLTLELGRTEEIRRHDSPQYLSALSIRWRALGVGIQGVDIKLQPCRFRKTLQEVDILLRHKEIKVINSDNCIGTRPQPQWLDLDITIKQLRWETGCFGDNSQCRRRLGVTNDGDKYRQENCCCELSHIQLQIWIVSLEGTEARRAFSAA
jgi:hypothetical protein